MTPHNIARNILAPLGLAGLMTLGALAQPTINKVPPSVITSPVDAKGSYTQYCAVCHGTLGKGDGPAAVALKKAPADLTRLAKKNGGKYPETRVSRYITGEETVAAHGTRDMPVWSQIFHSMDAQNKIKDDLRVYNLVAYIKTLQVD